MRLIAGLATLLSVLCFATGVSAHASLVSAEPGDGSVLAQAPKTVQLRFNEAGDAGRDQPDRCAGQNARRCRRVRAVDETIVITLPENLPRGTQVVSYRVISADGHPVAGSLVFSIGAVTGRRRRSRMPARCRRPDLAGADRRLSRAVHRRRRGFFRCLDRARARRLRM